MASLAKITTESQTDKTPDEVLKQVKKLRDAMYPRSMTREEFQKERTRIISEMLDNPNKHGIYPTGKCFHQLDELFDRIKQ